MEREFRERAFPRKARVQHGNLAILPPAPAAIRERQGVEATASCPIGRPGKALDRKPGQALEEEGVRPLEFERYALAE